jgi:hypothetical protein
VLIQVFLSISLFLIAVTIGLAYENSIIKSCCVIPQQLSIEFKGLNAEILAP